MRLPSPAESDHPDVSAHSGIDLAGVVLESSRANFKPGDRVVLNGWDLSMGHHGLAQRACGASGSTGFPTT